MFELLSARGKIFVKWDYEAPRNIQGNLTGMLRTPLDVNSRFYFEDVFSGISMMHTKRAKLLWSDYDLLNVSCCARLWVKIVFFPWFHPYHIKHYVTLIPSYQLQKQCLPEAKQGNINRYIKSYMRLWIVSTLVSTSPDSMTLRRESVGSMSDRHRSEVLCYPSSMACHLFGTNFCEILIRVPNVSFDIIHLREFAKCQPFC